MKRILNLGWIALLAPLIAYGAIAPRTVLLETFTNVSCSGCAPANLVTGQYIDATSRDRVVNVQYHVNWPHPADPYYLADPVDITGRTMYYTIGNAPDLITDGANTPAPGIYAALADAVETRCNDVATVRMDATLQIVGLDAVVDVNLDAVGPVAAGDPRLRVALVEEYDEIIPAPGSNGETEFHWTVRRMLPDHDGTAVTLSEGDTPSFQFTTTLDPAWADSDLHAVVWLQDDATREILQSTTTAQPAAYAAAFYAERFGAVMAPGLIGRLDSWIENTGTQPDTYDFVMTAALPASWSVSACAGTLCYPPWITTFSVTLLPGESILIAIDVIPDTMAEGGTINMTATSQGDAGLMLSRDFAALAPGSDVLFVDADGGYPYETYFTDALTAAGATHQTWDRAALGHLTAADLAGFGAVVWNADLITPALTEDDRTALTGYLAVQGDLLLSGQDIAFDLDDAASPNSTPGTREWYEHSTGSSFGADDSHDTSLTGVAGDPIGNGLLFNIAGGSGANNQGYPDVLTPAANARTVLEYAPGQPAAVRYLLNGAHVVTLGFGFEGIDTAAHRSSFLTAVLAWFAIDTPSSVDDLPGAARIIGTPSAHPNPFNPSTTLSFTVSGAGSVPVTVDVFDLSGRLVRRLLDASVPAGDHTARWDGRDDDGSSVPSGVYLARVRAGDDLLAAKLLLAK